MLIPTSLLLIVSSTALARDKPNIVFMMTNNLGYGDVDVYGGGELRGAPTPRIDSLDSTVKSRHKTRSQIGEYIL